MKMKTKLLIPFYVKNWPSVFAYGASLKYSKKPILDEQKTMIVKYMGKEVKFHYQSSSFFSVIITVGEIFIDKEYGNLNVKGKKVIDIGAFIGDTAIYFAMNGADHVYAFEAYPKTYRFAKSNIEMNGLKEKITLINAACGKDGKMKVDDQGTPLAGNVLSASKNGAEIEVWGLHRIVSEFDVHSGVLKMDCEGCEYEIMSNASDELLKNFDQIAIEYHDGPKELDKRLENEGFTVRIVGKDAKSGFIFADRK